MGKRRERVLDVGFGRRLRKAREAKDFTQVELASLVSPAEGPPLSDATVSNWECNKNEPERHRWPLIANVLDKKAEHLFRIDSHGAPHAGIETQAAKPLENTGMSELWRYIGRLEKQMDEMKEELLHIREVLNDLTAKSRPSTARET